MRRIVGFAAFLILLAVPTPALCQEAFAGIKPRMQKFIDNNDLSGAVTLVGRKDGVVHLEAIGQQNLETGTPMAKDSLFRIASMTKPITAIALMILVDEGKVNPEDDVAKYLPEFQGQRLQEAPGQLKSPSRPLKVRDLLTHTGGLAPYPKSVSDVYVKRNKTLAETTAAVAKEPLMFEPGTKWAYSNSGIDTLGRIIEVVSGDSYEGFLKKRIFDPLGMVDTTPYPTADQRKRLAITYVKKDGKLTPSPNTLLDVPTNPKHPVPAGGLFSTAADLAKLYRMMLNKGQLDGKRILSEKAVAEMTKLQTGDIKTGFVEGMGYGYGFAHVREPKGVTEALSAGSYGHGGAFGTQGWIDPKRDLFVVLLIQRTGLNNSDGSEMRKALQGLAAQGVK